MSGIRQSELRTFAMTTPPLSAAGYDVGIAKYGFDAFLLLRSVIADVIISDLNVTHMSEFEFLYVVTVPNGGVIPRAGRRGSYESLHPESHVHRVKSR